jgi:poly-gamma-glutamate capsule biosynthesis protein CapA/YwtB (metallophosphatase superfamily)
MTTRARVLAAGIGLVLLVAPGDTGEGTTRLAAPPAHEAAGSDHLEAGRRRDAHTEEAEPSEAADPSTAPADRQPDPGDDRPPPGSPRPRRFTMAATGDVLLHSPLWQQAEADAAAAGRPGFDFRPLLSGARPTVEGADLAVCHLETPLAPGGGPYSGYPAFSVPPQVAGALADTGYDACTTASNHVYDQGAAGIDRTLAALDAAGIRHAGSARSPDEARSTTLVPAGPARVALLSYTYGFNGYRAPNGETWRSNPIDAQRIERDARRARARGADVVVVALHWGDEYDNQPNAQQSELAPQLIRSPDIDLLLGHHAHVVQPLERAVSEWVVYGMGNLVARHSTPGAANEEGIAVRFTFIERGDSWRVERAEYTALLMVKDRSPLRLVDVERALADPATDPGLRDRLALARDRTAAVVASRGAADHGLTAITP